MRYFPQLLTAWHVLWSRKSFASSQSNAVRHLIKIIVYSYDTFWQPSWNYLFSLWSHNAHSVKYPSYKKSTSCVAYILNISTKPTPFCSSSSSPLSSEPHFISLWLSLADLVSLAMLFILQWRTLLEVCISWRMNNIAHLKKYWC